MGTEAKIASLESDRKWKRFPVEDRNKTKGFLF